jgi:hypothetical protein
VRKLSRRIDGFKDTMFPEGRILRKHEILVLLRKRIRKLRSNVRAFVRSGPIESLLQENILRPNSRRGFEKITYARSELVGNNKFRVHTNKFNEGRNLDAKVSNSA